MSDGAIASSSGCLLRRRQRCGGGEHTRTLAAIGRPAIAATLLTATALSPARAQTLTSDPGAWRPMSYSDLRHASVGNATFIDIWKDAIQKNNQTYREKGDIRFLDGNAPAIEAHFVVWSTQKSVVLSILDTAEGCVIRFVDQSAGATVKLCPVRIAQYQGATVTTKGGGKLCFLELDRSAQEDREPSRSAAYAAYDIETKTIKTGMIVNHKAVDGCSIAFPLHPR